MKDLKVYDITLDDWDAGVYAISLVDEPAIMSNFIFLSKEDGETPDWFLADEEKREVIGAVLIPNKLIYRKVKDHEFYIRFPEDVIKDINAKMQETGGNKYFTIQHELDARETVKLSESWIKETEQDKSVAFGINEEMGTLFVKLTIHSDLIWSNIKDGKLNGFSVELDASLIQTELNKQIKKESMNFKSMYANSIVVNDNVELLFNGELAKSSVLFHVVGEGEDAKLTPFTGQFKLDNVDYTVQDALVTVAEDINLSIEQKLEGLIAQVAAISTLLAKNENTDEPLTETLDAILVKIEENKLQLSQAAKVVEPAVVLEPVEQRINVELLNTVHNWSKRWEKKKATK